MLSNEIIRGKLLSEDGTLALIVLALDPDDRRRQGAQDHRRRNPQGHGRKTSLGAGLTVQLSGVPIMQLEIRNAVERDSCSTTPSASLPAA